MTPDPITGFGLLVLAVFRRRRTSPRTAPPMPACVVEDDPLAELRRALEALLDADMPRQAAGPAGRRGGNDHG